MYTLGSAQTALERLLASELTPARFTRLWDVFICAACEDTFKVHKRYGGAIHHHLMNHPELMEHKDVERASKAALDATRLEDAIDLRLMHWYARNTEAPQRFLAEHPGIHIANVLDILVRRHERFVYRSARSHTKRYGLLADDAWDLTGQVFEALISHPERFRQTSGSTFRAWLGAIVRNKSVDLVRQRSRQRALMEDMGGIFQTLEGVKASNLEGALVANNVGSLIRRHYHECLEHLARNAFRRYQAWVLCVEQGLNSQQAATIMGCTPPTVRRAMSEARVYLKSHIEALCLEHNIELRELIGNLQPTAARERVQGGPS